MIASFLKLVEMDSKSRALTLLDRYQVLAAKENVQIRNLHFAGRSDMYRLQHHKEIIRTLFDLGSLMPVPAVFDMQRVEMVLLGELVQLRVV